MAGLVVMDVPPEAELHLPPSPQMLLLALPLLLLLLVLLVLSITTLAYNRRSWIVMKSGFCCL
jgi:hypothetical protein